jgi:hypothetical protein
MSHNHYLGCRACGVTTEAASEDLGCNHPGSCYHKFFQCYGDSLVEHAHATKAMQRAGLKFESNGWVWAEFVAQHADCNAFYELCGNAAGGGWEEVRCGCPRRIEVKDGRAPACPVCHGRRLVPCKACANNVFPQPDPSPHADPKAMGLANHIAKCDAQKRLNLITLHLVNAQQYLDPKVDTDVSRSGVQAQGKVEEALQELEVLKAATCGCREALAQLYESVRPHLEVHADPVVAKALTQAAEVLA